MSQGSLEDSFRLPPDDLSPTEAERAIRGLAQEVAYVFDAVGRQLFRRVGTAGYTNFATDELPMLRNLLVIHNHPDFTALETGARAEDGGSFSASDLEFVALHDIAEIRAISGRFRHRLTRPEGGWPEPEALVEEYRAARAVALVIVNQVYAAGRITSDVHWAEVTHRAMIIVAAWAGAVYQRSAHREPQTHA